MEQRSHKIVIVGAGPAGCSCAIRLRQLGAEDVTLVQPDVRDRFHIGESVAPDIRHYLRQLNLFDAFLQLKHEPCFGSRSYWGSSLPGFNDSLLNPFGHGWHLDRSAFNEFLLQKASETGVNTLLGYSFHGVHNRHDLVLKASDGSSLHIEADLIVDATGSRSLVAKSCGSVQVLDYPLICFWARFSLKDGITPPALTQLEAVQHGWWYAAKIPDRKLLVAFYTDAETVKELGLQKLDNWQNHLTDTQTIRWLKEYEAELCDSKLMAFPVRSFCLDRVVGDNWLAIGDAASTYDPITSQGVIKALAEGIAAADYLAYSKELRSFENDVKSKYKQYQDVRSYYYGLEQRWPDSSFWSRMHGVGGQVLQSS